MTELQLHPLCSLFPRMDGDAFDALVADIKANGLREPIVMHDGMILDGGNRYRACQVACTGPTFTEFDGDNLVTFVLSANLHRRHMTIGQQAAIVAAAQDWGKAQPALRPNKQTSNVYLSTRADRAALAGASMPTQRDADRVAKADPELGKQVARGEISLPAALERITGTRPKPKQKEWAKDRPDHAADVEPGDAFTEFDPRDELEKAHAEIARLQEQVAALSTNDGVAELAKQMQLRQHAERRADQVAQTNNAMQRQMKAFTKFTDQMQKLTGRDGFDDIVAAVRAMGIAA